MAAASLCAGLGVKGSRESCSWRLHSKEKPRTSFMTHWGPRTGSESRYISCCQAVYTVGHLNSSWSEKYCDAVLPVCLFTDNLGRENNHHLYNCFCHQDWCSNHLLCCTELDPSLRPYSLYFHWLTANVSLCAKLWFLLMVSVEILGSIVLHRPILVQKNNLQLSTCPRQTQGSFSWEHSEDSDIMADWTGDCRLNERAAFGTLPRAEDTGGTLI